MRLTAPYSCCLPPDKCAGMLVLCKLRSQHCLCVQQGWFASDISIRLEFDGELLRGHETPASKDCDEGDVIDVMF